VLDEVAVSMHEGPEERSWFVRIMLKVRIVLGVTVSCASSLNTVRLQAPYLAATPNRSSLYFGSFLEGQTGVLVYIYGASWQDLRF
jgi:hypothetical protein